MSIASEIERLQNAKSSLKTALENKGVEVPSGATLSEYAELVDGIQAGGGELPTLFAPSIDLQSITSELTITDNKNGAFEILYDLYAGGNKLATLSSKTATLTDYIEHTETLEIKVQAIGTNFNPSEYAVTEWRYMNAAGTPGLAYEAYATYSYAVCMGIGDAIATDIEIASEYEGFPVTKINYRAFKDCTSITSVVMPDSVTNTDSYPFQNCSNLTSAVISNNLSKISDYMFNNCSALTSIVIPDSVKSIGTNAFSYCSSLASINIPNGVTKIPNYMCAFCSSLPSIVIPDSVTSIGDGVFRDCTSLTSVVIGNSVTSIGEVVFYNCNILKRVDFSNHTSVPTLSTNVFGKTHADLQIKVPENLIEEWKNATNWAEYADKIVTEFTNEV